MEIDHIDVINLCHRYPDDSGFQGAGGQCNARVTSLVLVYTDGPQHLNPLGPYETMG